MLLFSPFGWFPTPPIFFFFLFSSFRLEFCFTLLIHCCCFFYIFIFPNKSFIFMILFYSLSFVSDPSFWLVPHPTFFSFFCCGFILPYCSCFHYSFIFPYMFFIFLILFCFLFFDIVLLLFSFLSSFFFLTTPQSLGNLGSQTRGQS